ncbi:MAG: hypothetical protein NC177_17680 [Ruminococcus flavefaciens]|nr:hypothetical protein [Ruminococcus flavefaciens]
MENEKLKITAEDVLGTIKTSSEFIAQNPQVIDAVNHIVKNGVKQGGYDIVKSAVNSIMESSSDICRSVGSTVLSGLNNIEGSENSSDNYENLDYYDECDNTTQYPLPKTEQQNKTEISVLGGLGTAGAVIQKTADFVEQTSGNLARINNGIQNITQEANSLGRNVSEFKNTILPTAKSTKATSFVAEYADDAAEVLNYGLTETAVSSATSTLSKVGSSAAKGGVAGAVIGITMETVLSYKKWKNGEITADEYKKEILKSGGQMGISGAATAGIMTALSVPLATAGLATAPITIPISIALGTVIDKIVAPAFGRGDYQKILGEAKYYQNLLYAHDDLVRAIEMTESQFAEFIDEQKRQTILYEGLKDTNRQLKQLHTVANNRLQQQKKQINNTFNSLNDLLNKI